jgi:hypothetical protein
VQVDHAVTKREARHASPEGYYSACKLMTGGRRELDPRVAALSIDEVTKANPAGCDLDQQLPKARAWGWELLVEQLCIGLLDNNSVHLTSLAFDSDHDMTKTCVIYTPTEKKKMPSLLTRPTLH